MTTQTNQKNNEEELEKQRSKILQLFVQSKGKLTGVMVRGKDPVCIHYWYELEYRYRDDSNKMLTMKDKIKEQLKIDPTKQRAILFFNGVELESDQPVFT